MWTGSEVWKDWVLKEWVWMAVSVDGEGRMEGDMEECFRDGIGK